MNRLYAPLAAVIIACAAAAPAFATDRWIDRANAKYEYLYWKPAWAYHPIRGYDGCKDGLLIHKQRCRDNYFQHYKRPHHKAAAYRAMK
ncbi:MAG: hypothetical protein AB7G34_10590 [Hyphomicrobiales bacterium]